MARLPTVAIIGRPNTGKSTLFNRLVGRRQAIISDTPGTTRDHVAGRVETDELDYLLVDTGGMGGGTEDADFEDDVHAQSLLALESADLILFTVNSREELTASDYQVVALLRSKKRHHVPVIVVVTKTDNHDTLDEILPEYWQLGIGEEIVPVSALNNLGTEALQRQIITQLKRLHFSKEQRSSADWDTPRVAVVGKPNVGKSSLVNALMSDAQRRESPRLVSPVAGTTRDATDTVIRSQDREFIFVDTAGLKRQARTEAGIDSYAMLRSIQAVEQADVCVLVLDATEPVSRQDKRIAGLAAERGTGIVILLNKTDLVTKEEKAERLAELQNAFPFCRWAPVIPVSAETREGLLKLFDVIQMIQRNRLRRLPASELQRWFQDTTEGKPLGPVGRAKHITQADAVPPTFVLFVKNPKEVQVTQLRFLENRLRETWDFAGTPVRWISKGGQRS